MLGDHITDNMPNATNTNNNKLRYPGPDFFLRTTVVPPLAALLYSNRQMIAATVNMSIRVIIVKGSLEEIIFRINAMLVMGKRIINTGIAMFIFLKKNAIAIIMA